MCQSMTQSQYTTPTPTNQSIMTITIIIIMNLSTMSQSLTIPIQKSRMICSAISLSATSGIKSKTSTNGSQSGNRTNMRREFRLKQS